MGEPFLSYVFLRGVDIIHDQFVWEKSLSLVAVKIGANSVRL